MATWPASRGPPNTSDQGQGPADQHQDHHRPQQQQQQSESTPLLPQQHDTNPTPPRRSSTFRLPTWTTGNNYYSNNNYNGGATTTAARSRHRRFSSLGGGGNIRFSVAPEYPVHEVHPHHDDMEPVLPAAPVAAYQETRLHKPNWALSDEPPNAWAQFRHQFREEFAEFWGTFLILLFGTGVECEVRLNYHSQDIKGNSGDFLQCRLAWAAGVSLAGFMSGGVSGGHCNPTVTIVLALFRGFPKRKILPFILAQILGAFFGSLVVYLNYVTSISAYEGEGGGRTVFGDHATAGLFFTLPARWLPYPGAVYTEILASATLVAIVFALADKGNFAPPRGTQPFAMFLAILGIGSALGVNTGYAMNGARDTGPRIALALVGYGWREVFTHDYWYWLWAPWASAIAGGILGATVYDSFLYLGRDSPVNIPSKEE